MVVPIRHCRTCHGEHMTGRDLCDDPECRLSDEDLVIERSAQMYVRGERTLQIHERCVERVLREGLRPGERPYRRNSGVVIR